MLFNLFILKKSCSHKLWYEGYLELTCSCLLDEMYTKLTCIRISYEVIICVYENSYVMVVQLIFKLEITK